MDAETELETRDGCLCALGGGAYIQSGTGWYSVMVRSDSCQKNVKCKCRKQRDACECEQR